MPISNTLLIPELGELRHIQKLRFWPLGSVLHEKYLLPKDEAELIASFLNPMLRLHPDKRAKAGEMKDHAWLDGVVVQGEIDVIRRAEEDERRKKEVLRVTEGAGKGSDDDEDDDAMKPVEESASPAVPASATTSPSKMVPKISIPANANLKENVTTPATPKKKSPGRKMSSPNAKR